jgi:hypothetical protein
MRDLGFDHERLTVDRSALESMGAAFWVASDLWRHDRHLQVAAMLTRSAIRSDRVSESAAWYHGAPIDYDYEHEHRCAEQE